MTSPSSRTPARPLPSEKTQVAPYSWLRRHIAVIGTFAPFLSGAAAWVGGILNGVDPIKALERIGLPVASLVVVSLLLAYVLAIYIPEREARAERTRQALLQAQAEEIKEIVASHAEDRASHAEDRAAFLQGNQRMADGMSAIVEQMKAFDKRLGHVEKAVNASSPEEPTQPGRTWPGKPHA